MGFFSRLFAPAWQKQAARGRAALERNQFAIAYDALGAALSGEVPAELREELTTLQEKARDALFDLNWGEGERNEAAEMLERAQEHYELAKRFAPDDERAERVEERLIHIEQTLDAQAAEASAKRPSAGVTRERAPSEEIDGDEAFELFVTGNPDEIAERYLDLPASFRSAYMNARDGEWDAAIETFTAMLDENEDGIVRFELGRAYANIRRFDEAIEHMLKAESSEPLWIDLKLALARVAWSARRYDVAEAVLQRAADEPGKEEVAVYRAIAMHASYTREPSYGLDAAAAGLDLAPRDVTLNVLRGRLLELSGRDEGAIEAYERVVLQTWRYDGDTGELSFNADSTYFAALHYLRTRTKLDRAEELMRAVVGISNQGAAAREAELDLAAILLAAGKKEDGTALIDKVARLLPPDTSRQRAYVAWLRGEHDEATAMIDGLADDERERWENFCKDRGMSSD